MTVLEYRRAYLGEWPSHRTIFEHSIRHGAELTVRAEYQAGALQPRLEIEVYDGHGNYVDLGRAEVHELVAALEDWLHQTG